MALNMKNDDEMYQSVLSRWNEYQEKKKQRVRMIKRTLPVLACFCVVVMFGLDYWERLEKLPSIPEQPEIIDESTTENFETDTMITEIFTTAVSTEIQTTAPVVTTVETSVSTVTETEPISTTSDNPIEEPILEPVDFNAQPLSFREFTDVVETIQQNDVSSYDERCQETYRKMFEKFISDGFIYQPVTTDLISLKTDRKIILYPYAKYEDIGIQYFLTYKENNYRIKFYCADTAIVSEINDIAEYLQKRMGA